jgi:hypothetical protein
MILQLDIDSFSIQENKENIDKYEKKFHLLVQNLTQISNELK